MTEQTTPENPYKPRAVDLALAALGAAIAGDDDTASLALAAVVKETDIPGLMDAIYVWCDTLITQAGTAGQLLDLEWIDADSDRVVGAEDVPEEIRWAGHLLLARAGGDRERFVELIRSLDPDPFRMAAFVGALFALVADNLKLVLAARRRTGLS
ncbi:hypothetical protein [Nonomuraea sp. NPDC050786]|uniref:hypothetical protein n=1 Tax=Nonomuraea sp. NPDC050786 TaxID=3154840 RepID=UPI0033E7EB0D